MGQHRVRWWLVAWGTEPLLEIMMTLLWWEKTLRMWSIRRSFPSHILGFDGHYSDVIMSTMAPQITSVSIVCSSVCSGANQRKHQSSASMAFVKRTHRWPVNSPHKGPVTRKNVSIWWRHHEPPVSNGFTWHGVTSYKSTAAVELYKTK